uniref:3-dehydrosphinganine reductase n=1 Tax=Caenorhabditis tropicalis TaxID=1561998 RepID=A0A1I7U7S9_9PELO
MSLIWLVLIPVIAFILFLIVTLFIFFSIPSRRDFHFFRRHAIVTGGSKGIGYQLAVGLIERGCNVTIIARNVNDLKRACGDLQTLADQRGQRQKVQWKSIDMTADYEVIKAAFDECAKELGPIDILINNAGHSVQAPFCELPVSDFEKQMKVNYLSAVYATRAVVDDMKQRKTGHISFVSSAAGQFAIFGYSAYSPTKFALRGFADTLHMELLPYKVNVGVLYPPNTDTEGFKLEQETMPEETKLMSDAAGLFTPKFVAEAHLKDIADGNYATTIGLDGWMLGTLTAGASPEKSLFRALTQGALAGIFRAITLVYLGYFNGITKKCYRRRLAEKEEERENERKAE